MLVVLMLVCSIVVWVLYHKLFDVIYFDFFSAFLKEILISVIIGAFLAYGIMKLWYVSIPVAVIAVIAIYKKNH